ncbi:hypothetical protein DVS77_07520 [Mycolicibacterium moriokaense]|nr:hypothetical protein DVS77_07520 [Mycolicibacterium moriokaense]
MTTLETKAETNRAETNNEITTNNGTPKTTGAPASSAENSADTTALITEQQVLLGSAAALAPAPARHSHVGHQLSAAVRAMFTRPEKPQAPKHYPQRFAYLERSAMSREMDRL